MEGVSNVSQSDSPDEKALGATVILAQLNAVITGASIILAAIGAFVALKEGSIGPPSDSHLLYATIWAVAALFFALWCSGMLPTLTIKVNFVRSPEVAIFCAMGLYFTLASGARFLFAVRAILFP
jgi:hypothetical protein